MFACGHMFCNPQIFKESKCVCCLKYKSIRRHLLAGKFRHVLWFPVKGTERQCCHSSKLHISVTTQLLNMLKEKKKIHEVNADVYFLASGCVLMASQTYNWKNCPKQGQGRINYHLPSGADT